MRKRACLFGFHAQIAKPILIEETVSFDMKLEGKEMSGEGSRGQKLGHHSNVS